MNPNTLENVVLPLAMMAIMFVIPIVAILTSHQRKMAEMFHKGQGDQAMNASLMNEMQAMRSEMAQMRETLNRHEIQIDDRRGSVESNVKQRLAEEI